jgi:hypothetical protein
MATYQRGYSYQEETVENGTEHRNIGKPAYSFKCKSENQAKVAEWRLVGEQGRDCT